MRFWFSLTLSLLLLSLAAVAAAPLIEHTPPGAEAGRDVIFRATIRAPGGVYNPELLWRAAGSSRYRRVPMRAEAEAWVAVVPARELPPGELEYFLQAFEKATLDEGSWRSPQAPQRIQIKAAPPSVIEVPDSSQAAPPASRQRPSETLATGPLASRRGRLFLRAQVDAGVLLFSGPVTANGDYNADADLTATGAAAGFGIAAGIFLRDDLALSASLWNAYSLKVTLSPASPDAQDAKQTLIALGPQLTYYLTASDISVSAMAGLCATHLNANTLELHLNTVLGFGARVALNKEWPISDFWAVGIGGQISYAINRGEGGRPSTLSNWILGGALSATFR